MRATLGLAGVLLLLPAWAAATPLEQQYFHRNWRRAEGLPGNSVYAITQSSDRYLWVGTEAGLARFDGRHFVAYGRKANNQSPKVFVTALQATGRGKGDDTLWIGTERGLLHLRIGELAGDGDDLSREPWTLVMVGAISALARDPAGGLWIGTRTGLLHRSASADAGSGGRGGTPPLQTAKRLGLDGIRITHLLADGPGELWVGTEAHGLWRLHAGRLLPVGGDAHLAFETVTGLVREADGALLVFTSAGGRRWRDGRWLPGEIGTGARRVDAVAAGPHDDLWLATQDLGITHVAGSRRSAASVDHPLVDAVISTIFVAADHTVWVGSGGDGLHQLVEKSCVTYTRQDGLAGDRTESVLLDDDSVIRVGTQQGLTTLVRPGGDDVPGAGASAGGGGGGAATLQRGDAGGGAHSDLLGTEVLSLMRDRRGTLWAGTAHGIARAVDGRWSFLPRWGPQSTAVVNMMFEDSVGNLWIASTSGLAVLPGHGGGDAEARGVHLLPQLVGPVGAGRGADQAGPTAAAGGATAAEPLPQMVAGLTDVEIIAIAEADDGALWIGTRGAGLLRLYHGLFTTLRTAAELPIVNLVWRGRSADFWVGGFGSGLLHYRDGHWYRFDENNGLPDDTVRQVLEDHEGDLWLCSGAGISRISRRAVGAVEAGEAAGLVAFTYGPEDGVTEGTCYGGSHPGAALGSDGHLWFATAHGLVEIRPERMAALDLGSTPHLDGVVANSRHLALAPGGRLEVPGGLRRLDLRFSAPLFVGRRRALVHYRLAGFDHDWILDGGDRVARYTSLPPADYGFEVELSDGRGGWRKPVRLAGLAVRPLYYERGSFWMLAGLLLAALAVGVNRLSARALRSRAAALENQVAERTEALREANRRLEELATTDALTGLANRRRLQDVLDREIRRGVRSRREVSLVLVDVDFFKSYNDKLGHVSGDDCLRRVAAALGGSALRVGDLTARYGGEEFAVLLPETPLLQAYGVAETIRLRVLELAIAHPESTASAWVTVSAGVASVVPSVGFDSSRLVEAADTALYRAKQEGRNRALMASRAAAAGPRRVTAQMPPAA